MDVPRSLPHSLRRAFPQRRSLPKIWEKDPEARFYGGTSRDLAWFVRRELSGATSREDLAARVQKLKSRPIDAKEFIVGQSDVDIITSARLQDVEYDPGFLTRIETISPDWFKPGTTFYKQESRQGYVPVEKIRLGPAGFETPEGLSYGDGIREIYEGRPTLHFDPRIVETDFYKNHENHPIRPRFKRPSSFTVIEIRTWCAPRSPTFPGCSRSTSLIICRTGR